MTFQENADRSVNTLRILFDLDITQLNTQWVNAGAGVWYVNDDAIYSYVDSSLLTGFTAQLLPQVGSVVVDSTQLSESATLLYCCNNENTFYWDGANLYIHITGGDAPFYHSINIGVVNGFSREGFTPIGSGAFYASRLLSVPNISLARDPLFFGKLQYDGGSVELNNGDGGLDLLGEDYDIYGNQARISIGFEDLPIADYQRLYTGFVETYSADETTATVTFKDKRKQLGKQITYTCSAQNGIDAIQQILLDNYGFSYDGINFDTTAWEIARAKAYDVTINITSAQSTISVIQGICESIFGVFIIDPLGRFSAKIIRPGDAAEFSIPEYDILNYPRAVYDPSEVVTSVKVGYAKDWTTTGSAYTYYTDTTQEATIYAKYKTYNERKIDTYLPTLADAQVFSAVILDYSGTVRPILDIEVPLKYWNIGVGDFAEIEINRANATWFGLRKCEIVGKSYNLDRGTITFTIRKYGNEIAYRITTDGYMRSATAGEIRKVGQ